MSLRCHKKIFSPVLGIVHEQLALHSQCRSYASDSLLYKKIADVTCIGFNRPESKNRLNISLIKSLKEAIDCFEKDEATSVAVLYGERGNFSYGYDINEINENPNYFKEINEIGLLETCTSKPIIAAISGYAVGFAFDVALWCDFRVVEDTAVMGGYARKFGVPISDTIAKRLYNSLGLYKSLDLVLTGRILKAKEAFEIGIATRLVACGTGLGQAVNFANSLANMPQACLKAERATILSFSEKFSSVSTKELIMDIKNKQRQQALKEAEKGLHFTSNEDVRKRFW